MPSIFRFSLPKIEKKTEEPGDWLPNRSCSIYKQAMFHKGVRRFLAPGITVSVAAHFGSRCKETPDNNQKGSCVPSLLNLRLNATTKCEGEERPSPSRAFMRKLRTNSTGDSFPNFSRHGKSSMLKKYLSHRVYSQLENKETLSGVRLDHIIRAGVSLPLGADPPRGVAGVYVGDAESYTTFSQLLNPIIEDYHGLKTRRHVLQRHRTNLNPQDLHTRQLDPDGRYILYTRLRLARSLRGFRFAPCITRAERRDIEKILVQCCKDWEMGDYRHVMDMSNETHDDLIKRRILPQDPDLYAACAGTHRDWPDARGVYCDTWEPGMLPSIMIWCNMEDHFWILSTSKGGDVQDVFTKLSQAVAALETSLHKQGYEFVEDKRLGFLNASPANIGTALRASVHVKLVRLGRQKGFDDFVRRLRLEARPEYPRSDQRYSGIFDIGNKEALGKSEVDLINVMIDGVAQLIALEKRLEQGEELDWTKENEEMFLYG